MTKIESIEEVALYVTGNKVASEGVFNTHTHTLRC